MLGLRNGNSVGKNNTTKSLVVVIVADPALRIMLRQYRCKIML